MSEADWTQSRQMGLTREQYQQWKEDPARFDYSFGQYKDPSGRYLIPSNATARTDYVPTEGYQGRLGLNDQQYSEFAMRPTQFAAQFGQYRDATGKYNIPVTQQPSAGVNTPGAAPVANAGGFQWGQQNTEPGYWGLPKLATTSPNTQTDPLKRFQETNYFGLKNYGA